MLDEITFKYICSSVVGLAALGACLPMTHHGKASREYKDKIQQHETWENMPKERGGQMRLDFESEDKFSRFPHPKKPTYFDLFNGYYKCTLNDYRELIHDPVPKTYPAIS